MTIQLYNINNVRHKPNVRYNFNKSNSVNKHCQQSINSPSAYFLPVGFGALCIPRQDNKYRLELALDPELNAKLLDLKCVMGTNELGDSLKSTESDNFNPQSDKFNIDLHLHTTASDGKFTPETLFTAVKKRIEQMPVTEREKGFVVAITDHDTVEGVKETLKYIVQNPKEMEGIRFVPGIEFSTFYENEDFLTKPVEIHLLLYGINPYNEAFKNIVPGYKKPQKMNCFEILKSVPDSFAAIAHPIRMDFKDKLKPGITEEEALLKVLKDFKEKGGRAAEANYQMNEEVESEVSMMPDLCIRTKEKLVADKVREAGLICSGGVDNHGDTLYKRK